MVGYYDNWERLVEAVMRREQLRQLSLCDSMSSVATSFDSSSSEYSTFTCRLHDHYLSFGSTPPSPSPLLHSGHHVPAKKTYAAIWKRLSIFVWLIFFILLFDLFMSLFFFFTSMKWKLLIFNWKQSSFSSKKGYGGREERELDQWAKARTTTHGHEEMRGKEASTMEEEAKKRRAEIARFDSGFSYVIHGFLLRKMNFLSIFFFPLCYDLIGFKNCTLSRVTLNHWWRPKASISIRCIITIQFEISGVSSSFESIYSSFDNVDDPSFIGLNYKSRASKVFENVNYGIYFNCVCLAFQFVFKIYFNSLLLREYYIYLYSGRSILLLAIWSYRILIHVTIWSYSIF